MTTIKRLGPKILKKTTTIMAHFNFFHSINFLSHLYFTKSIPKWVNEWMVTKKINEVLYWKIYHNKKTKEFYVNLHPCEHFLLPFQWPTNNTTQEKNCFYSSLKVHYIPFHWFSITVECVEVPCLGQRHEQQWSFCTKKQTFLEFFRECHSPHDEVQTL